MSVRAPHFRHASVLEQHPIHRRGKRPSERLCTESKHRTVQSHTHLTLERAFSREGSDRLVFLERKFPWHCLGGRHESVWPTERARDWPCSFACVRRDESWQRALEQRAGCR